MSRYILDANVLITAYRLTYPMDVIPSFWERLLDKARDGTYAIIDSILEEINKGEDPLKEWIASNIDAFTILQSDNTCVLSSYAETLKHVSSNSQYFDIAKDHYAASADSWLVAHAHAHGYIIVTEETFDKNAKRRVKIPNICRHFGIEYVTTVQFLRAISIKI